MAPGSRVAITSRSLSAELQRRRRSARVITSTRPVAIPPYALLKEPRLAQEDNRPAQSQAGQCGGSASLTVVRQISKEIMADPVLAKGIIEPLKSQGVAAMGDFAIQVKMKFMAKPGEQFVVRRAIYDKIKKAFEANGINFAFPTVTVAAARHSRSRGGQKVATGSRHSGKEPVRQRQATKQRRQARRNRIEPETRRSCDGRLAEPRSRSIRASLGST